jgi:MYXO-CTERM domain-containing protein
MRRRRPVRSLIATAGLLALPVLGRELPDFHIRTQTLSLGRIQMPNRSGVPGQVASRDERTGAPTFIWADPSHTSQAVSSALAARAPVEAVARAHLGDYAAHFGLDASALQALEVRQVHDTGTGAIVVRLAPRVGNLEIYGESVAVVMDRYRQPIAISGTLHPSRQGEADALLAGFKMRPEQVVSAAYRDLVGVDGFVLRSNGQFKGDYQYFELASSGAPERLVTPARAKPLAFRNGKTLVPAYYIELDTQDAAGQFHGYAYIVSAKSGQLLVRNSLINSAGFTYRVYADTSGQFRPWDGPFGNGLSPSPSGVVGGTPVPPTVGSNLVTLDHGPIGNGDPWLPAGATVTTGNNVDAYTDTVPPDGFTAVNPDGGVPDLRADVTAPGTFDRTFDFTQQPDATLDQAKAAVTQLFFTNNWLHDWYYDVGFDEASGNAQADNLGRGDPEHAGDVFHAEAHDSSGVNNANMFTPADGASPRQQMYLWTGPQVNKLTVNAPAAIAGDYSVGANSTFGPQGYSITGDVVLVNDGSASPTLGCNAITNNVTGKIALIDRGTCPFVAKVKNAQNAGAIGVIIANNAAGTINMGGTDGTITIGALMVSLADANTIKTALASNTVNVTLFRQDPTSIVKIDGSFDNAVIAHEWGHYIAHRLVGGGYGFVAQVTNGMGEGWSDFHALLLIVRPEDPAVASNANWSGTYGVGVFDTTGGASIDPVYFAIRRYPYSTDMTKDPLTFKHITTGVALPAGVPVGFTAADNAEVHATGEIWATMLWECYAALLNAHDFQTAQDRMRGYIVAAYKATPPNATFVEARDALLAVVSASDGADYQRLGQAFAKRGLGTGAIAPDRFDTTNGKAPNPPLVESFFWGADIYAPGLTFTDSVVSCDQDGVLDRGETGILSVMLQNGGKNDLSQGVITVSSTTPGITIADGGVFGVGAIAAGKSGTVRMPISLALTADAGPTVVDLDIALVDPEVDAGVLASRMLSGTLSFRADTDDVAGALATDDVEGTTTAWTVQSGHASNNPWVRIELTSPVDHAWFAEDPDRASDESLVTPPLQVGTGPLVLTFQGSWFEEFDSGGNYDGVVVEVSDDNGATWKDVKSVGGTLNPDYNVTLLDEGTATVGGFNPLQGRPAWGQANPAAFAAGSFPTYETVTVNLGTAFANKTVRVRFRSGSDGANASTPVGFLLDNLAVTGITNTPFVKLVADRLKCVPTADAGTPITVNERTIGALSGSVTQTPGTTPPTLLWTQTSGPAIALSDPTAAQPTFTAPDVPADTTAGFTLTATGIQGTSTSTTTVTIKDVNRPPIARITGPTEVEANGTITLSGSTSTDPDNDTLTYAWTQTSGPNVTLNGANTASMSFTAPDNSGNIGIQLTVTDSKGASATATTTIAINKKSGCSSSGGSPAPLLALLALGLLARVRRRTA